jgi:hypothetical protein
LATYEVLDDSLHRLGILDVGHPTDENDHSVADRLAVEFKNDAWQVRIPDPIVLRPNQESRSVITRPSDSQALFEHTAGQWHLVP